MMLADVRNADVACSVFYNLNNPECFSILDYKNKSTPIPYIVEFGSDLERKDDCTMLIREIKNQYYEVVYENDFGRLYLLK